MKFIQKVVIAVSLSLILLALVFWLARVLFIVSDELESFSKTSWDENPWGVAQTQIELERMRVSLEKSIHHSSEEDTQNTIERIEIFWSRVDIVLNGPNNEVLKNNLPLNILTHEVHDYLVLNEENVYTLPLEFQLELKSISTGWSKRYQENARATYQSASEHIELVSKHTVTTYSKIRVFLIFIAIFSIILLAFLILLLKRNNRLLNQAKAVSNMKTDFLANMSHELRTPLNGIIGSINLFKTDQSDSEELIEILDRSSEALLAQIDDILDYSQIEAGQLKLENLTFCLRDLIIDCTSIFKIQSDNKNLFLDISTSQDLDINIIGDKSKLRQVILNLINNAIKFTEHGGITIDISYKIQRKEYEIDIKIIDTGIGISEDNQKELFNSFSQADTSIKRRFGGSGLGLSISRKLIEAMNGNFKLESKLGKGTQIGFSLILDKGSLSDLAKTQEQTEHYSKISNKKLNLSGKKILVVEDNIVNQKIITKILNNMNVEVFIAQNGIEAIEYPMQGIDLVFMDIQMPQMDGVTATKILRKNGINIPIIALTANATQEYKQQCNQAGMDEFLSKPFNLEKIESILVKYF